MLRCAVFAGYESGGGGSTPQSPSKEPKEAEVDALTSLLVQNMEAAADPDFFGQCLTSRHAFWRHV